MGAIVLLIGVVGLGAVTAAVIVFAVTRSRRNSGMGGLTGGTYMGHSPQQVMAPAQPPYPAAAPNQGYGYTAPPAQPPQQPNPYTQQPPPPGQ